MEIPYDLHYMFLTIYTLTLLQKFFTPEQIENPKLVLIVGCTGKMFCLFTKFLWVEIPKVETLSHPQQHLLFSSTYVILLQAYLLGCYVWVF